MKVLENLCIDLEKLNKVKTKFRKPSDCEVILDSSKFNGSYNNSVVSNGNVSNFS